MTTSIAEDDRVPVHQPTGRLKAKGLNVIPAFDAMQALMATIGSRPDAGALESAAHALKSLVGNFAAQGAFEAALRLESKAHGRDLMRAEEVYAALEAEIAKLRPVLADIATEAAR